MIAPIPPGWSAELEASYEAEQRELLARSTRVVALVGALAVAGFGVADLAAGETPPALLALRFGVLVPILVATVALSYATGFRHRFEAFAAVVFGGVAACDATYVLLDEPGKAALYQTGFVMILLAGYSGTRIRCRYLGAAGLAASALDAALLVSADFSAAERNTHLIYVATANVVGLLVARHHEALARQRHADRTALQQRGDELRALNEVLRDMATRDSLTGLLNRRALEQRLPEALALCRRNGGGALAMLDLDGFKTVNDSLGHAAGDELLQLVAQSLAGSLRAGDSVFRVGGDEFCILFPCASEAAARVAVERALQRIRTEVAALSLDVTFSAGLTSLRPDDEVLDDVLARADHLMYRAKAAGKAQVVVARPAVAMVPAVARGAQRVAAAG